MSIVKRAAELLDHSIALRSAPGCGRGRRRDVWSGPAGIIVSDYRLGDTENGVALIARMRAVAGREFPACVISGDMDAGLVSEVNRFGLRLLHKPVRPAKLRSLLRQLWIRSDVKVQTTDLPSPPT